MPRISRRSPRNPPLTQAADSSSRVARPRPPRRGRGPSGRGRSGSQAQASQPLDDHVLSAIRAEIQAALRGTPQPGSTSPGSTSGDASGDAQPSSSENAGACHLQYICIYRYVVMYRHIRGMSCTCVRGWRRTRDKKNKKKKSRRRTRAPPTPYLAPLDPRTYTRRLSRNLYTLPQALCTPA